MEVAGYRILSMYVAGKKIHPVLVMHEVPLPGIKERPPSLSFSGFFIGSEIKGLGELGREGAERLCPRGRHAVWGLLAGSLAHPASSGWADGTWRLACPLPAWHCGLLAGGRPLFQLQEL